MTKSMPLRDEERASTCPMCGYNLTGLSLPRPCPECGRVSDPAADHEAAYAWFCSRRGFFWYKPPPHAARYLHDPRCRRVARRRLIAYVALPWLVTTLCLLALSGVAIDNELEVWWEQPGLPGERLHVFTDTETDRLLAFNLNLHIFGDWSWRPPTGAMQHQRVLGHSIQFSWPRLDALAAWWLAAPTLAAVGALWLPISVVMVRLFDRRYLPRRGLLALCAAACPSYLAGLTVFLLCGFVFAVTQVVHGMNISPWNYAFVWTDFSFLLLSAAILVLGGVRQTLIAIQACRPSRAGYPGLLLFAVGGLVCALIAGTWLAGFAAITLLF